MPISNIPFDKSAKPIKSRYENLLIGGVSEDGHLEEEHAAFLAEATRTAGPVGFIDARRHQNHYNIAEKASSADETSRRPRQETNTLVSLTRSAEESKQAHERQMRLIEESLIHTKQDKRDLKRTEGDIVKTQQQLRGTMRQLETEMQKKKYEENRRLAQSLARFDDMTKESAKKKQKLWHERYLTDSEVTRQFYESDSKGEGRKGQLQCAFQERERALDTVRGEIDRLTREYEQKLKAKEDDQTKITKQLTELAIQINMEAHKQQTIRVESEKRRSQEVKNRIVSDLRTDKELETKVAEGGKEARNSLAEMNRLDGEQTSRGDKASLKMREQARSLDGVRGQINQNQDTQKQLHSKAFMQDLDQQLLQQTEKVNTIVNRRNDLLATKMDEKKTRETAQEELLYTRAQNKLLAEKLAAQEDNVKTFQKEVERNELAERTLAQGLRQADIASQQQQVEVRRLQEQLLSVQSANAEKLRKEKHKMNLTEEEHRQKLMRKQAAFGKAHAERSDTYQKLNHRAALGREEQLMYDKHKIELEHTLRINQQAELRPISEAY